GALGPNLESVIQRRAFLLASGSLLLCGHAAAEVVVQYRVRHRTSRSVDHVLAVLNAHDRACDRGCEFRAPNVEKSVILDYQRRPHRYYIWTYVKAVKET